MTLRATISRATLLEQKERQELFGLHARYYANVSQKRFMADLAGKDWVILLRDVDGVLAGFSTAQLLTCMEGLRPCRFLFSGDTVVDQRHWHDSRLAGAFGHLMLRMIEAYGEGDVHWFLISKGFRTYRFLPVFFNRFFPVFSEPTPPEYQRLLDVAATARFGDAYDPACGLIRFGGCRDCLRPGMNGVPERLRRDPHVRFFLQRNPGYAVGDELACIANIARVNLNERARRVIERTSVTWQER